MAAQDLATSTVTMDSNKVVTANFSQVTPDWKFIISIIAGVIVIVLIIWFGVKSKTARHARL